jgi:alanine racemase
MQHQYTATQIAHILDCESRLAMPDAEIYWLLTDSRKVVEAPRAIFFALEGKQDSEQFIPELLKQNVFNFVVRSANLLKDLPANCNVFVVPNVLQALQKLASFHRQHFQYPVIGITGSNGKTVVKDWLYQLLSPDFSVVRSPKSYNSQIGVPISVWQMNHTYSLGIFEAGISRPNEMEHLEAIIQPTIGILTNIKSAHDEGFTSRLQKAQEKIKLFSKVDCLIYCKDNVPEDLQIHQTTFSWSTTQDANLRILEINRWQHHSVIKCYFNLHEMEFSLPFSDEASIENAITCIATLFYLNYSATLIQQRLLGLQAMPMRLEMKKGIQHSILINDSYSADLASVFIAVDFLMQQQHAAKTVILSDMVHVQGDDVYQSLADYLHLKNIDRFIGVGPELSKHAALFKMEALFFPNTEALLASIPNISWYEHGILIKAARSFAFERVVQRLEERVHETVLEINLNAIVHNLNFYRSKCHSGTKLMAMVKAFAYGSGSFEIANILQYNNVDYLAVAYADEGVELRNAGITLPIMVMSPEPSSFQQIIRHKLEPELYNQRILDAFALELQANDLENYPVHIKLDTGMHRLGFGETSIGQLTDALCASACMRVMTVFSHFAAADDEHFDEFTKEQLNRFDHMNAQIRLQLGYDFDRHICNTAAALRFPEAQYEMVRIGIGLYGIETVQQAKLELQTVGRLKTTITQIQHLAATETVGYGRRGVLDKPTSIATIKIGYADGFARSLGNGNYSVMIRNKPCKIIGSVCMDMCMVDITNIEASEGDEVIVFGEAPTIEDMALAANTIPYEVLTSISQRVQRIYYYE